ncbi:MAG: DUF1501 domain-containing protein [Armatimonadota bacterium]|jgi:uncharacterized protein (DUF1501 family)|nr:DUF1501 domain-containing protein [Fimbriimonadaceae bacterium]
MSENNLTRRELLAKGTMIAVGLSTPRWLAAVAHGDLIRAAGGRKVDPDNILVVCQLSGGNDGLNTVVPFADSLYAKARPTLALKGDEVLHLNEAMGLHPTMGGLATLYKEGKVAIVQNVGYPNPNRSHFKSMDIWQSASPDAKLPYGWIGRSMDERLAQQMYNPVACVGLSTERPLALQAKDASIPCFASLADIKSLVGNADAEKLLRQIQGRDAEQGSAIRTIQDANRAALDAMNLLNAKLDGAKPKQTYGENGFGRGFAQISQLLMASPQTRVVYFSHGGFDTHSRQKDAHAKLMQEFSDAVLAFQREMEAAGLDKKVTLLVFSEFGRRVEENGSLGTDHGEAAPMFLIGSRVKGGFHGPNPDLANLSRGDVPWKTDFRSVYATTLENWLGNDAGLVLGSEFPTLDLIKS